MEKKTTAERSREYRARQRALKGDQFLIEQNQKRKARRLRAKERDNAVLVGEQKIQKTDGIIDVKRACAEEALRVFNKNPDGGTLKTIESYYRNIAILYEKMNDRLYDCKDLSFLKDVKGIITALEGYYPNTATRKKYINSITRILKFTDGYKRVFNQYEKIYAAIAENVKNTRATNIMSDKQKGNFLKWEDLTKRGIKDYPNTKDALIYALYTEIPPRRAEYRTLRLTDSKTPDDNENWIVINKNGAQRMILNVYKTAKFYGSYTVDLKNHKVLQRAINQHIEAKKLKVGDYLLDNASQPTFTKWIQKVFKQGTAKPSINILRQSYVNFTRQDKKLSMLERQKIASQMGHSTSESNLYEKFNV